MAKIYTKTGDKGETSLVSGTRLSKGDDRIHLYGEVDELNSLIGVLSSHLQLLIAPDSALVYQQTYDLLQAIQSALFDLGSNLACEPDKRLQFRLPQLQADLIDRIELTIDEMQSQLEPLKNFILPGGSVIAAHAHVCRCSARKVERLIVAFHQKYADSYPDHAVVFLNRLSDYFFTLARCLNYHLGVKDIPWKPQKA